jgi:chromatin remodeling complex protein RSC6
MTTNDIITDPKSNDDLALQCENVVSQLNSIKTYITNVQQDIKQLEKNIKKQMKGLKKEVGKTKNKGNRQPSGFAKPSKVSKELCTFMNKPEGSEIARTDVTRALIAYIKENSLQGKTNSRVILPDEKLKNLLGLDGTTDLTYFNMQVHMNKHFISYN